MKTIGITGGVGAGKSTVLDYLRDKYHAYLIVADELAKELELPGHACYDALHHPPGGQNGDLKTPSGTGESRDGTVRCGGRFID